MATFKEAENGLVGVAKAGAVVAAVLGVALVAGAAEAVKSAGKFQQSMELIRTQAGASQKEVDSMAQAVLSLSGQVATSPLELADALYHLESTGFRGAKALEALRISAEGAKVGGGNLVDVTNALDAVLVAGVKEAKNMTQAMGELNAIVGAGDMKMQDLADAMGTGILATAKTFGLSLLDVGAALAVLGDNNIRGAEAATKLRMEISLLGAPTAKAQKELKSIGITALQLANDMRSGGLIKALQDLQDHLRKSGKTASEQAAVIAGAFGGGKSAGTIMLLLEQLDRLKTKYKDVAGGTKQFGDAWATTQGNLNFKIDAMKAAVDAAGIKIGLVLLPYVSQLLGKITPLVPKIADWAEKMTKNLVPQVQKLAGFMASLKPDLQKAYDIISTLAPYIIAVAAAWALWNIALGITKAIAFATLAVQLVAGLIAIVTQVGLLTIAQWALNVAMDANPIGVVIIAIAALVAGVIWAYNNWAWFRFAVNAVWGALKAFASQFWSDVKPIFDFLGPVFHALGDAVVVFAKQFWADIKPIFDWLIPKLQDAWNWLGKLAQALGLAPTVAAKADATYVSAAHQRGGGTVTRAAHGYTGTVYRPTLFLAGEAGVPEDVNIGPRGSGGGSMAETNRLLREQNALLRQAVAGPSNQTGVAAALHKAVTLSATNRLRGMAGG